MNAHPEVIIVGAGPVGLLLAVELKLGDVQVMVLERLTEPSTVSKGTAIGPLGVEALQRRSMGAALAEAEERHFASMGPAGAARRAQAHQSRGHFAMLPLRFDAVSNPERRMQWVNQQTVEAILRDRVTALGIPVQRGCTVTGMERDANGVVLHWTSPDGLHHAHCAWVVGCDGGRSTIRKLAGFSFPGTPPSQFMYQAVLDLDHPERLPRGTTSTAEGSVMNGPRPRWIVLHDYSGPRPNRTAPVTRDEIESLLRRISGADVRVINLDHASYFTDSARLVDSYQRDRVLLAGDAAHIHAPLGGQGLSLGLGDAANLGWKLAAILRGEKPDHFLASYTTERRPIAEAVLANTLAQVALTRPDPQSNALRQLVATLMKNDAVNRYLDGLTSGLATRYELGETHDLVGTLIADRPIGHADARTTLFTAMADGNGIVLDATSSRCATTLATGFLRLHCVSIETGPSMLIRPDGCVAWANDAADCAGLTDALMHWFSPAIP